jgi:hypothetical protein
MMAKKIVTLESLMKKEKKFVEWYGSGEFDKLRERVLKAKKYTCEGCLDVTRADKVLPIMLERMLSRMKFNYVALCDECYDKHLEVLERENYIKQGGKE